MRRRGHIPTCGHARFRAFAALAGIVIAACREATPPQTPSTGLHTLLLPSALVVAPGSMRTATLTVARPFGLDAPASVSVDGLPDGVSASPLPYTMPPDVSDLAIDFVTEPSAPLGRYSVEVRTNVPGLAEQVNHLVLEIVPVGGFRIALDRTSLNVDAGFSAPIVVRIFGADLGPVDLSVRGLPNAATVRVYAPPGLPKDTRVITVSTSPWVQPGEYLLTVIGTTPGYPPHGVALPMNVKPAD